MLGVLGRRGCSWGLVVNWKPPVPSLPACHLVAILCGSPSASFICRLPRATAPGDLHMMNSNVVVFQSSPAFSRLSAPAFHRPSPSQL